MHKQDAGLLHRGPILRAAFFTVQMDRDGPSLGIHAGTLHTDQLSEEEKDGALEMSAFLARGCHRTGPARQCERLICMARLAAAAAAAAAMAGGHVLSS